MKTKQLVFIVLLGFLGISAYKIGEDILSTLGLDPGNAQFAILANLTQSPGNDAKADPTYFKLPRPQMLAAVMKGDKVAAATDLCDYIKMYCNSEEFSAAYNSKREAARPTTEPPQVDAETIQMTREGNKAMEEQIADMKKNGNPSESIKAFEEQLRQQKAMLAEWEDPTPNKTRWEKDFPADPGVLVKKRIDDYLALVATVDFDAQLTAPDNYKIQKFVKPEYESKSAAWKACYRAGKEVNGAVTAYVTEWSKGEIISANKTAMPVVAAGTGIPADQAKANTDSKDPSKYSDGAEPAVKEKKSLMGKLKDKAKAIIKD